MMLQREVSPGGRTIALDNEGNGEKRGGGGIFNASELSELGLHLKTLTFQVRPKELIVPLRKRFSSDHKSYIFMGF